MTSTWRIETMVLPEQIKQSKTLKVKVFLSWPIEVVFGLSTICIIIEMKMWASEMHLQIEFDYWFSRSINESLKRQLQCSKPYSYFTSSSSYYPHTFVCANYSDFLKLRPPNTNKLPGQQMRIGKLSTVRAFPKNCAKYDNQTQPSNSPY